MLREYLQLTSPIVRNRLEWNDAKRLGRTHWIVSKGLLGFACEGYVFISLTMILAGLRPWRVSAALNLGILAMWIGGGCLAAEVLWRQYNSRYDGH